MLLRSKSLPSVPSNQTGAVGLELLPQKKQKRKQLQPKKRIKILDQPEQESEVSTENTLLPPEEISDLMEIDSMSTQKTPELRIYTDEEIVYMSDADFEALCEARRRNAQQTDLEVKLNQAKANAIENANQMFTAYDKLTLSEFLSQEELVETMNRSWRDRRQQNRVCADKL